MSSTNHVVVVTFDNTDSRVYGLYDDLEEAELGVPVIRRELAREGVQHHVESITPRPLRR